MAASVARSPASIPQDHPLLTACGKAVRRLREAAGISQENFAKQVGIHRTYMSILERGRTNPSLTILARIAEGLGLSLSAVVAEIERGVRSRPPARVGRTRKVRPAVQR